MTKTARCKFAVSTITKWSDQPGVGTIKMNTQYDSSLAKEDQAFSVATPSGNMEFQLNNPNLEGFFVPGKAYYIDITPVE